MNTIFITRMALIVTFCVIVLSGKLDNMNAWALVAFIGIKIMLVLSYGWLVFVMPTLLGRSLSALVCLSWIIEIILVHVL